MNARRQELINGLRALQEAAERMPNTPDADAELANELQTVSVKWTERVEEVLEIQHLNRSVLQAG